MNLSLRINEIIENVISLRNICYPEFSLPINYLTIFSQSDNDFEILRKEFLKLGEESVANNGFKYQLNTPIHTRDEVISCVRMRKPDIHRQELGCADLAFQESEYPKLREMALKRGFDIIVRDGYEMIELVDFKINVYAYLVKDIR